MNPIKKIIDKFINRHLETPDEYITKKGIIDSIVIYQNDNVNIVHDACKECYKGKACENYDEKADYIARRIQAGHESILEHSNVIVYIETTTDYFKEMLEFISECRYLETEVAFTGTDNVHVLIGGSIRGYKHIIRNIKNQDNIFVKNIIKLMYQTNYCFFIDFIHDGIMSKRLFNNFQNENQFIDFEKIETDIFDIVNVDDIFFNKNKTYQKNIEMILNIFKEEDLLRMLSITIYVKGVSRVISQQLTRHRCGITQLSQRYVDYSDCKFNPPNKFKLKYNDETKYDINIKNYIENGNTQIMHYTLSELGNQLCDIYSDLRRQGLEKEDARAYLPNNVTTSLYMTFNFYNFIKFLQLRTDKAAQAEVNILATELLLLVLEGKINLLATIHNKEDIDKLLIPIYKKIETTNFLEEYEI